MYGPPEDAWVNTKFKMELRLELPVHPESVELVMVAASVEAILNSTVVPLVLLGQVNVGVAEFVTVTVAPGLADPVTALPPIATHPLPLETHQTRFVPLPVVQSDAVDPSVTS